MQERCHAGLKIFSYINQILLLWKPRSRSACHGFVPEQTLVWPTANCPLNSPLFWEDSPFTGPSAMASNTNISKLSRPVRWPRLSSRRIGGKLRLPSAVLGPAERPAVDGAYLDLGSLGQREHAQGDRRHLGDAAVAGNHALDPSP